jgi:uncharacterized protein
MTGVTLKNFWLLLLLTPLAALSQGVVSEEMVLVTPMGNLKGTLTLPAGAPSGGPVVLLIAGSGPTDRNGNGPGLTTNAYLQLADSLAVRGVAMVRYDKRGIAASRNAAPREELLTFDTYVQDAIAWVDTLRQMGRFETITVIGHSEGSLVGMLAARQAGTEGYISLAGAGRNVADVLKTQLAYLPDTLRRQTFASLDLLRAGEFIAKPNPLLYSLLRPSVQPYMISWMRYTPAEEITRLTIPSLIIQGKHDLQVPMDEAKILHEAKPEAGFVIFEKMNHVLKDTPAERNANLATYSQPELPLSSGLVEAIVNFVKSR